jgi:PAS domain S-box-containing protein
VPHLIRDQKELTSTEALLERLRLALDFSEVGEWTWDPATDAVDLSPIACAVFGCPPGTQITWQEMQAQFLHAEDAPLAAAAVVEAIDKRSHYRIEYRIRRPNDGEEAWVLARGKARYDEQGRVVGMLGLVQDVTERKLEQLALAEEAQTLEILNRTGTLVASELDLEKLVQAVTDAGVRLTHAQFGAFFYNVVQPSGELYMLYTISGVPREKFAHFPMPRNTPVFAPTFAGEGIVRVDDITQDPRYGRMEPHHGMPPGHLPVRSYLAVPVVSRSGEVIGGLFFGHSEPGIFDARAERVMMGVSAQAAIAIDNARLYNKAQQELQEKQRAEAALRGLADALEVRVRARTAELEESYRKLQREIEDRERAEEALRHAQKLEAIGQLTGGVAHDFNNLLTVVIGNLDTLLRRLGGDADPRLQRPVEYALEGARKGAVLTQRLLAFARRQPLKPEAVDPNRLVQRMSELLHRTLGEPIEIETVLAAGIWAIEVDIAQLESAILNLAVNARDAMPEGGKLTIETSNVHTDEAYSRTHGIDAGQYVCICVSDTGVGIAADLLDKVFDPFFTTKTAGQGTGLGLSQVYGFVKQSGGNVRIYSEMGEGTTVKLYLPRYGGAVDAMHIPRAQLLAAERDEAVLVVEDDERVRQLSVSLFEELGYSVLQAPDGPTALEILARAPRVDLLFTDVGLPKMNGRQLAEEARKLRPTLKVLFTTGYAKNAIVHHGRLDRGVDLIGKPFTFAELSEKVRDVLDRR